MKRNFLFALMLSASIAVSAQTNLLVDGGFEKQTVYDNQVARISGFEIGRMAQTENPYLASPFAMDKGIWCRKSPNTAYLKGTVSSLEAHEGSKSLLLSIGQNCAQVKLDQWYNNALTQFVKVDRTKKYTLKVWAKAQNNCEKIFVGIMTPKGSPVKGSQFVDITSEWAEYTVTVEPAAHPNKGNFSDEAYDNSGVVVGINTTYNDNAKTNACSVFLDNIQLYEEAK